MPFIEHWMSPWKTRSYRAFLVDVGQRLKEDDLTKLKFVLKDDIPEGELEKLNLPLDVFSALEKRCLLGPSKLQALRDCLEAIDRPNLIEMLDKYADAGFPLKPRVDNFREKDGYRVSVKGGRQLNDKSLQRKAHTRLGHVHEKSYKFDAAAKSVLKAHEISRELDDKKQELNSYLMLGNCLRNTENYRKAKKCYEEAMEIALELDDKHCVGTACFNLASICSKDGDYEMAVNWYKKALDIIRIQLSDHLLEGKTLTGLGDTQKAIEAIRKAKSFAQRETVPAYKGEYVSSTIVEACNPSRTEKLTNENYMKTFHASYVYTRPTSSKEPLTEKVRKFMTRNVKLSAYCNLVGLKNNDKFGGNDETFVKDNQRTFNFAKDDVYKNASTKIPARLLEQLCSYTKSIGQISCGKIRGTCFLVKDTLVITNHHVCMMINKEREELQNSSLPIRVLFDYLYSQQTEHVVTAEVDEVQDPHLENPHLDYKFLRLKENEGLRNRVRLGQLVRSRPLQEGLVVIVGHPEGNEMHQETCVVISSHSWREKLHQKHAVCAGVHMTNAELLESTKKYEDCLPYETSLFSGTSGSPVFDLEGNIVAMHTQGYTLDVEGGKCSLIEFGVQFSAICDDLRQRNVVDHFFPSYKLGADQQPMDED